MPWSSVRFALCLFLSTLLWLALAKFCGSWTFAPLVRAMSVSSENQWSRRANRLPDTKCCVWALKRHSQVIWTGGRHSPFTCWGLPLKHLSMVCHSWASEAKCVAHAFWFDMVSWWNAKPPDPWDVWKSLKAKGTVRCVMQAPIFHFVSYHRDIFLSLQV